MTDAKPIDPSTERVANTVAFLLRFSDDYEKLRTKGAETPITEMLEKLEEKDKEELFLKAHQTIAEMDEAMQEPSFMNFLKGINLQEMAEKAKTAAKGAAEEAEKAAKKIQEMGSEEIGKFKEYVKKIVGDRYDSLPDDEKAKYLEAYEKANKMYGDTKAAVGDAASKVGAKVGDAANTAMNMKNKYLGDVSGRFGSMFGNNNTEKTKGGKRKNKTKKLTKKEKKMKRARK